MGVVCRNQEPVRLTRNQSSADDLYGYITIAFCPIITELRFSRNHYCCVGYDREWWWMGWWSGIQARVEVKDPPGWWTFSPEWSRMQHQSQLSWLSDEESHPWFELEQYLILPAQHCQMHRITAIFNLLSAYLSLLKSFPQIGWCIRVWNFWI